jgi:hypothetical protein
MPPVPIGGHRWPVAIRRRVQPVAADQTTERTRTGTAAQGSGTGLSGTAPAGIGAGASKPGKLVAAGGALAAASSRAMDLSTVFSPRSKDGTSPNHQSAVPWMASAAG